MNKVSKILSSLLVLLTLSSCSQTSNIDRTVAFSFEINCGECYEFDLNKFNQVIEVKKLNEEALLNNKRYRVVTNDYLATLNNVLKISTSDNENNVLFSFDSNCNKNYMKFVLDNYLESSYRIVGQVLDATTNDDVNNVAAIYGLNYGYANFVYDLSYDYPQYSEDDINSLPLNEKFDLFKQTHSRTLQAYQLINLEKDIDISNETTKAIEFFKTNTSCGEISDSDLVKKSYIYKGKKHVQFALYKGNIQAFVAYEDGIKTTSYFQEGITLLEGKDLYTEYKDFYDSYVEPYVNRKANEILGSKFKTYRDYIYNHLLIDGRYKINSLGFNKESLVYEYILGKIDCYKTDVDYSIIEYYISGPDRYYKAMILTNSDTYVILGNAFSCQVMKIYKNGEVLPFTIEITDDGFSLETISKETKGGQY